MSTKAKSAKASNKIGAGFARYNDRVGPVIREVQGRRGMAVEIARQFSRLAKCPTHRNTIDSWLRPDVQNRVEPSAGNAEILFEAVEKARQVMDGKAKAE